MQDSKIFMYIRIYCNLLECHIKDVTDVGFDVARHFWKVVELNFFPACREWPRGKIRNIRPTKYVKPPQMDQDI